MTPRLGTITRHSGVAGQYSYRVGVYYPEDEGQATNVEFVGSVYGAPIVMVTRMGMTEVQRFVDDAGRFGPRLDPDWVRKFFGLAPRD